MAQHLLFVDDDLDILEINRKYFQKIGFKVDTALCAEQALALFHENPYDCAILDICMTGTDGYELCQNFRNQTSIPVIFLTALTQDDAMEEGFSCGADDYLAKPYSLKELELRINARISTFRQLQDKNTDNKKTLGLRIDTRIKQAYINNTSVGLTSNEFEILYFLYQNKGSVFRQAEIYRNIWGENYYYNSHSIQTLVLRIRKKLSDLAPDREFIRTEWGKGYMFIDR